MIEPKTRLQERGADAGRALQGSVELALPYLPGALDGWIGVGGARLDGRKVDFTLTNSVVTRIRPRQPYDDGPVPVLATPRLAAAADSGGLLPLQIGGERISVRVVGTVRRFPGVDGQAVVGDGDALAAVVNLARPGAARVNEVWLGLRDPSSAAAVDRALAAKPFDVLTIESRHALEADARRDPIAHGTLIALAVAAAVALLLALAGILLTVVGDLRDERGELFDLEAQGASPSLLRRIVRLRAASVAVAGLVAGALTGVALAAVVTDLVGLTARATAAEPPLVLAVDLLAVARRGRDLRARRRSPRARGHATRIRRPTSRDAWRPRSERARRDPGSLPCLRLGRRRCCRAAGADDDRPAGRAVRRPGSERLGQVDAAADRRGLRPPVRRLAVVAGTDVGLLGRWQAAGFRSRSIGYADQHYWRALAGELTARELVGVQLGLAGRAALPPRRARGRAALARGPGRPPRRASARALRRRAAAHRALRGAREPTAPADRRRADGRARCGHRARGARPDRGADPRGGRHGARRQPRSRLGATAPTESSTSATAVSATSASREAPTARSSSAEAAGFASPRSCCARPESADARPPTSAADELVVAPADEEDLVFQ